MSAPNLKAHFTFAVEEVETQMNMFITPIGETAKSLPDDFSVSVGYSKDYTPEMILSIIAEGLFENLPVEDIKNLGGHGTYEVEFADQNTDASYTFPVDTPAAP